MKHFTHADVLSRMEENDWNSLHDVVLDAAELAEQPSKAVLYQVFLRVSPHILGSALQWGFGDTVVRDDVYVFVEQQVKEHGSLTAWLALPVVVQS